MKKFILLLLYALFNGQMIHLNAQDQFQKVDPPHWWAAMNNDTLHLLFYGSEISVESITCNKKDNFFKLIFISQVSF